jgi:hypothetical protein
MRLYGELFGVTDRHLDVRSAVLVRLTPDRHPFQPGASAEAAADQASSERAIAEIWISSVPA